MADDVDVTGERSEVELARQIQMSSEKAQKLEVEATGHCLFCGEETEHRFCDAFCRDGWEKEKRLKQLAGRFVH